MQEPEEGKVPWNASSGYDKAVVLNHSQQLLSPAESLQKIKPVSIPVHAHLRVCGMALMKPHP